MAPNPTESEIHSVSEVEYFRRHSNIVSKRTENKSTAALQEVNAQLKQRILVLENAIAKVMKEKIGLERDKAILQTRVAALEDDCDRYKEFDSLATPERLQVLRDITEKQIAKYAKTSDHESTSGSGMLEKVLAAQKRK